MYCCGMYRSFQLYCFDEDEIDRLNAAGSHFIRNSIIVFVPDEPQPKIGREWRICKDLDDVVDAVNEKLNRKRTSMKEQLARVSMLSAARELEIQANSFNAREREIDGTNQQVK